MGCRRTVFVSPFPGQRTFPSWSRPAQILSIGNRCKPTRYLADWRSLATRIGRIMPAVSTACARGSGSAGCEVSGCGGHLSRSEVRSVEMAVHPEVVGEARQVARVWRRFPNLLCRRFPNWQTLGLMGAPPSRETCGFGNPRHGRLGSLRYQRATNNIGVHR